MDELKVGAFVYLNSGSPALTVANINSHLGLITVNWAVDGVMNELLAPVACFTNDRPRH